MNTAIEYNGKHLIDEINVSISISHGFNIIDLTTN